jgi:hypothetical protein
MKEQLRQTIEVLKDRVKDNLSIIHDNEREVRRILEEPVSKNRSAKLEIKYNENKKLLKENNDSIQLQLQITKFLETYKNELESQDNRTEPSQSDYNTEAPQLTREECFDLTINGDLKFDHTHPYFDDDDFFEELLDYYKSTEDYEMCSFLVSIKRPASK